MTPLFFLPFDHRASLARELLGVAYPVNRTDGKRIIELRKVIFDGFLLARKQYRGNGALAILTDEEFGRPVIATAKKHGIPLALTMEASGKTRFTFDRLDWRSRLHAVGPMWAKALVHYVPGNEKDNATSRKNLKLLSDYCKKEQIDFLLEPLVGDGDLVAAIRELRKAGVRPTLWKLEGRETMAAWHALAKVAGVPMIVLGRNETQKKVDAWLTTGAKSGDTIGLAVGRTVFMEPLKKLTAKKITKKAAVAQIAKGFLHCITVWEKGAR